MSVVIRPIQKWDIQQVTALCAAVQPERIRELKVHLREVDEPEFIAEQDLQQWVAVEDETQQCVGFAAFWNVVRRKYRMNLMVRPDWRRRRVGGELFETILTALQTTPAATLQARTWDERTDALEFLDRRGFCEVHRMIELQVKLSEARLSPFAELPARLTAQGNQFTTWREAGTDESFWAKLIDLVRFYKHDSIY